MFSEASRGRLVFNEFERLAHEWGVPTLVIIIVFILKGSWCLARNRWVAALRKLGIAIFVGLLANNYMLQRAEVNGEHPQEAFALIVVAVVAFQADSIVAGLFNVGKRFKNDPIQFVKDIRRIFKD